jgi:hypothetical protein
MIITVIIVDVVVDVMSPTSSHATVIAVPKHLLEHRM